MGHSLIRISHQVVLPVAQQLVLMVGKSCGWDRCSDDVMGCISLLPLLYACTGRQGNEEVKEEGRCCNVSEQVSLSSSVTHSASSSSSRCGVLIMANPRLVAGGCGAAWRSQGSNDGSHWPRAPGGEVCWGWFPATYVEVNSIRSHTHSHAETAAARSLLRLPLGEKREGRSKQRGVFAQVHTTPHPSLTSLSFPQTQSFLPLSPSSFSPLPRVYWSSLSSAQI